MLKRFEEIKDQVHDLSGIENPNDYLYDNDNPIGVYYPVKKINETDWTNFCAINEEFIEIEIEGCIEEDGEISIVDYELAQFFGIYVRTEKDYEARHIADLQTKELAESFVETIKSLIKYGKAIS
jgi:hypothetical protein